MRPAFMDDPPFSAVYCGVPHRAGSVSGRRCVEQADVRERLIASGVDPVGTTTEAFTTYVRSEVEKWAKVIKATDAKPD